MNHKMKIGVQYIDNTIKKYNSIEEIANNDLVIEIDCSNNRLTSLPDNMNFPNLHTFICSNNQLSSLPNNMNLPNLEWFSCANNRLTILPDNMNFPNLDNFDFSNNMITIIPDNMNCPNLRYLFCYSNMLKSLPENINFHNLRELHCNNNMIQSFPSNIYMNAPNLNQLWIYNNRFTSLPDNMNCTNLNTFVCFNNMLSSLPKNMNFPNIRTFDCSNNMLLSLPENMNFPNLKEFNCSDNNILSLPLSILNFRNLRIFEYDMIELSPQLARFINRIENSSINKIHIYNDMENIHNSNIQISVKDSINRLTTRMDVKKYNLEDLNKMILDNMILTEKSKSLLLEYVFDTSVHSLLLLTFSEVLWFVLQTINTDFNIKEQEEILNVLNQEIIDSDCKCFTGRMNRIVNSLNGFSHLVSINIKDNEQIGNIIILVKNKLESSASYTIEKHKEMVEKELIDRGYDMETIKIWIEYIIEDE
jgi:Leucine-rich repeat (LRR) protein